MAYITLDRNVLLNLEKSKHLEWLVTNGNGSYASSTVVGLNTSKYHGLLISSATPPLDRKVFLSTLIEEVHLNEQSFSISTNQYVGALHPRGFQNLFKFELTFFPAFVLKIGDIKIKKTIFMPYLNKSVSIIYE